MKTKCRHIFRSFRYSQCDDFAAFLNAMAARGWHFKRFQFGLVFEQGQPSHENYDVQIFLKNTEMDTAPDINTEEFAEYCHAAGWELIDSQRRFVVWARATEPRANRDYTGKTGVIIMAREQFQTLTEPMYYILLALLEERCGVDIMARVTALSNGRISVGPGTLYTMLPKFERNGIICQTRQEGRQKWYVATEEGKNMLFAEYDRLKQMLSDADAVIKR